MCSTAEQQPWRAFWEQGQEMVDSPECRFVKAGEEIIEPGASASLPDELILYHDSVKQQPWKASWVRGQDVIDDVDLRTVKAGEEIIQPGDAASLPNDLMLYHDSAKQPWKASLEREQEPVHDPGRRTFQAGEEIIQPGAGVGASGFEDLVLYHDLAKQQPWKASREREQGAIDPGRRTFEAGEEVIQPGGYGGGHGLDDLVLYHDSAKQRPWQASREKEQDLVDDPGCRTFKAGKEIIQPGTGVGWPGWGGDGLVLYHDSAKQQPWKASQEKEQESVHDPGRQTFEAGEEIIQPGLSQPDSGGFVLYYESAI